MNNIQIEIDLKEILDKIDRKIDKLDDNLTQKLDKLNDDISNLQIGRKEIKFEIKALD